MRRCKTAFQTREANEEFCPRLGSLVCDNTLHSRWSLSDWSPKYPAVRSCVLSVSTAIVGCQVTRICRGCRNADVRRPKLETSLVVLITGRLCIGTFTLRVRALPVFCPIGAIRRAASRENNAFHCRHRKNYYPCPSKKQDNQSGNVEREKSDERSVWRSCMAAKAHVRYAIFNACHHGHDAQSLALRTREPCIPIGNFPGLYIASLSRVLLFWSDWWFWNVTWLSRRVVLRVTRRPGACQMDCSRGKKVLEGGGGGGRGVCTIIGLLWVTCSWPC